MEPPRIAQEPRRHFTDYWRVIRSRWVIILSVFLLVMVGVSLATYFQPRVYMASATLEVERERAAVPVFTPEAYLPYDPYFLQTQYEVIQSKQVLYPVIERLKLQDAWGVRGVALETDIALRRLKASLAVRRFRDTSLIEIAVFEHDPRRAAEIANTIADVFEKLRLDEKRQETLKGIQKLREELVQQQERVRTAQQKVEQLRKDLNVPVFGSFQNASKLTDQTLQQLEQQLTLARVEAVSREVRLRELEKLSADQLRNSIATVINDPNVQQLLQDVTQAALRLEVLKEDYGPEHPNVLTATSALNKLQEQLDTRLEGIMRGFQVDYQVAQARVNELQKQLDQAKSQSLVLEGEKFVPFINAQREEEMQTRLYEALQQRIQQVSIEVEVPRSPVRIRNPASPPLSYVRPDTTLNLSVGVAVGLVLGVMVAFALEFADTSVKKIDDVERFLGLPVLGAVAQRAGLLSRGDAAMAHIEAYRMLRTNIEFALNGKPIKSLCVLSGGAGEGKSLTLANLAVVCAQHGSRVLVVDSDLRRPGVHQYLDVKNEIGLAEYLAGAKSLDESIKPTSMPNVSIITSGGGQTSLKSVLPMLTSQRMHQLIQELEQQFDVVLYDTPPVLGVSDAAVTAREVGSAILVIQHRRYPRAMALRTKQIIDNAGGKLLGVLVNNVHVGQDETYYYYHDQLERYAGKPTARAAPAGAADKGKSDEISLGGKY
jgi:capsular exopolysaccharide synthesis family protein